VGGGRGSVSAAGERVAWSEDGLKSIDCAACGMPLMFGGYFPEKLGSRFCIHAMIPSMQSLEVRHLS